MKWASPVIGMASMLFCSACGDGLVGAESSDGIESSIVDVPNSDIENQTIGNCWIYAISGWASSMHIAATGQGFDPSESYWTYMSWFDQITSAAGLAGDKIRTGGSWDEARRIIGKYGLMAEADFVGADTASEASYAQSRALAAIERALGVSGELNTEEARANRVLVREVMDRAWGLPQNAQQSLNAAFGEDMSRTFLSGADESGTAVIDPSRFEVEHTNGSAGAPIAEQQNLVTALNQWSEIKSRVTSRPVLRRVQQALHDQQPVIMSWTVDFNAFDRNAATFKMETWDKAFAATKKPGRQGGHMTVLEDYEIEISKGTETKKLEATVEKGNFFVFASIEVPEGPVAVKMMLADAQAVDGDADLYVRMGGEVSATQYDCRPYKSGSSEECAVRGPGLLSMGVSVYRATTAIAVQVSTSLGTQVLRAGETLDPNNPEDAALLEAALAFDARLIFFRVKNSWGTSIGHGFHDIYMDYLTGPIADAERCSASYCPKSVTPLMSFVLPPGY